MGICSSFVIADEGLIPDRWPKVDSYIAEKLLRLSCFHTKKTVGRTSDKVGILW